MKLTKINNTWLKVAVFFTVSTPAFAEFNPQLGPGVGSNSGGMTIQKVIEKFGSFSGWFLLFLSAMGIILGGWLVFTGFSNIALINQRKKDGSVAGQFAGIAIGLILMSFLFWTAKLSISILSFVGATG